MCGVSSQLLLKLKTLYEIHNYDAYYMWNSDKTRAQAGCGGGAMVIAKKDSQVVHSVIPNDKEWMFVLSCENAQGSAIPSFYIFWERRFKGNYILGCEVGASMAMQVGFPCLTYETVYSRHLFPCEQMHTCLFSMYKIIILCS